MSVKDLQDFISADPLVLENGLCVRKVNLLKLSGDRKGRGRGAAPGAMPLPMGQPRTALVLDAEHCLDRLYGGCYPDWTCGGEWRNMMTFLATLLSSMHRANVHVAVYFNGAVEPSRFREWKEEQRHVKSRVKQVLNHLVRRGTPPPKAFWVPPTSLRTMLRLALRTLNITVLNSVDDHRLEMLGFCWENGYHGVLSDDGEIALFCPPRYFSAHSIKLSMTHDLLTTEFVVDEVAKYLDLNPNRFCLLGALLGCHLLPHQELEAFHQQLVPDLKDKQTKVPSERVIRAVVNYIRALPSIEDFEKIGSDVFGSPKDPRIKKIRDSLKYYQSGTRDGYAKLKPTIAAAKKKPGDNIKMASEENSNQATTSSGEEPAASAAQNGKKDRTKKKKKKEVGATTTTANLVERIALDLDELDIQELVSNSGSEEEQVNKKDSIQSEVKASEAGKYPSKSTVQSINIPDAPSEVRRIALERHRQGQMSPYICQILRRGEIKLPVLLEDSANPEHLHIHRLYQPLRQLVYAILFNLHHVNFNRKQAEEKIRVLKKKAADLKKQEKRPDLSDEAKEEIVQKAEEALKEAESLKSQPKAEFRVREWMPYNDYAVPDVVQAVELHWGVPTVQRLWFSTAAEDKEKRLRAFLSCMRCEDVQSLMVPANVPQHAIILGCVLRYIMTATKIPVLQKPELDAFLVTAFSPEIGNHKYLAEMTLDFVSPRGVQLATLFMEGVEMAILANDACGAPVPFEICLPTFFDGKLFHFKLHRAAAARNLLELCDGRVEMAGQIERMRAVILHGIQSVQPNPFGPGHGHMPLHAANGRGNVNGRSGGGRLIVAGAVVSQWENNRGGLAQQRLVRARNKDRKSTASKSQSRPKSQKSSTKSKEGATSSEGETPQINGNGDQPVEEEVN